VKVKLGVRLGLWLHTGVAVKVGVLVGKAMVGQRVAVAVFLRWKGLRGSLGLLRPWGLSSQKRNTSARLGGAQASPSRSITKSDLTADFMVGQRSFLARVSVCGPYGRLTMKWYSVLLCKTSYISDLKYCF
jgi:hypothetical protein